MPPRIEPGTVLRVPDLGVTVEVRATSASTGGAYTEFDVSGRPRGVIALPHVHGEQTERHEVLEGTMRLAIGGQEHRLGPGEAMLVPMGVRHRQRAGRGKAPNRVRVRLEPAGDSDAFLAELAAIGETGGYDRLGMPRPRAAAKLVRDFGEGNRVAFPPLRLQHVLSRVLLRRGMS